MTKPVNYIGIRGTDIFGPVYDGAPCIVCGTKVEPGEGAVAMPPLPALHGRCLRAAVAAEFDHAALKEEEDR